MLFRTRFNAGVLWIHSHSQSQQLWFSSPVSRSALCVPGPAFSPDLDCVLHSGTGVQLKYAHVRLAQALKTFASRWDPGTWTPW